MFIDVAQMYIYTYVCIYIYIYIVFSGHISLMFIEKSNTDLSGIKKY